MGWDLTTPFIIDLQVGAEDIDGLGHANNAVYVSWLERCAWRHSQRLGLDLTEYRRLDRAMAVVRHEIDYLGNLAEGESLTGRTWVASEAVGAKFDRYAEFAKGNRTLVRAKTTWVILDRKNTRPIRVPKEVVERFA